MATDSPGDDDIAEVLIAGESELHTASVARFVAANGLRPRICRRVADAPWLLTHPHRVELVLYLKDAVGFGVCAAALELSIRAVELPAAPAPAPTGGRPGVDHLSAHWALACAAMDAVKHGFRSRKYDDGPVSQETPLRTPPPPHPDPEQCVLLVEDDAILARAVSRELQRLGHAVIVAHSAREAREHAEADIAYALVDHRLPGPEGLELGRWLASLPQGIGVAVYSGAFDFELAVEAGECGILTVPRPKPAELSALLERLRMRRLAVLASAGPAASMTKRPGRPPRKAGPVSGLRPIVREQAMPVTFRLQLDGLHVESSVGTIVIRLRSAERRIMTALALAQEKPVSREMLGRVALGRADAGASQSVKQHVSSVRGKLSEYEHDYLVRTTEDGKGYFLTQPVHVESAVAMG